MKNLHDIIQKNMETFEKTFPSIKDVAEKVGDTYGFPIYIQLKDFLLSSQLSIIQAMTELIQKEMYKSLDEVAQYKNDQCKTLVNKEDLRVWIYNLSDLSTNQK